MVVKKHILDTLNKMEVKYQAALLSPDPNEATYYSKLATLEYCGWIEETLDSIARRSVKKKLKTTAFKQMFDGGIIGGTHGFQYEKHFRPMMVRSIGIVAAEKLQQKLETDGVFETFTNELKAVKKDRDDAAHTWIEGTTKTYPAPSIAKGRLLVLYPILKNMYAYIISVS